MRMNRAIKVESKSAKIVKKPFGVILAYADEVDNSTPNEGENNPTPAPTINYEDLISKARKEEKEKQYKTIEKLKSEKETLTQQHNEDLLKIAERDKTIEELKQKIASAGDNDSEAVKTLKDEIVKLNEEKKALETKLADFNNTEIVNRDDIVKEVRAELEAEYSIKEYKLEQMNAHKDEILVPELVIGDTKEAIDESIKSAIERSNAIRQQLGTNNQPQGNVGTPKNPTNPSMSALDKSKYSVEDIARLEPASKEYAELRKQLGLR